MGNVISIYEAKTNLSKLVKRAEAGETIYIGAYGHTQAVIAPVPAKKRLNIGVWDDQRDPNFNSDELIGSDPEIAAAFEKSINEPLL